MTRIVWLDNGPHIVTEPELVSVPTHQPDANGMFGRVEYMASNVVRRATREEVETWRRGE